MCKMILNHDYRTVKETNNMMAKITTFPRTDDVQITAGIWCILVPTGRNCNKHIQAHHYIKQLSYSMQLTNS